MEKSCLAFYPFLYNKQGIGQELVGAERGGRFRSQTAQHTGDLCQRPSPPQQDKTNRNFLNTIIKVNKLCEWYYWLYGLGTSLLTSVRSYLTLPRGPLPHPSKASRYSVCSILGIKNGGESIGALAIHRRGYYIPTRSAILGLAHGEHRHKNRPLNSETILIPSRV